MAEQDGIILNILPIIDAKGSEAQFREIERLIKERIGKPLDKSFSQIIDKEKQIALGFERISKNRYRAVKYNLDESGKVKSGKQSIDVSERDAYKLLNSPSIDAYEYSAKKIEKQRKAADKRRRDRLKKADKQAEIDDKKAKLKKDKLDKEKAEAAKAELRRLRASQLSNILGENLTGRDKLKFEISEAKNKLSDLKQQFFEIEDEGSDAFNSVKAEIEKTQESINKMNKQLEKTTKVGQFQKLINTFKRVGFYRIARRLFQLIEQGFAKGIQSLIEFDDIADSTFSKMASASDKISASIALILLPAFQAIEPLVTSIADRIAAFANNISEASAQMQGLSSYTKISEKYLRSLREISNTLSFDKFEAISNSTQSPYETAKVDQDKDLTKYKSIINTVSGFLTNIKDATLKVFDIVRNAIIAAMPYIKALIPVIESVFIITSKLVSKIVEIVAKIVLWLEKNGMLEGTIHALVFGFLALKAIDLGFWITDKITKFAELLKKMKEWHAALKASPKLLKATKTATDLLKTSIAGLAAGVVSFVLFDELLKNTPKWVNALIGIAAAIATIAIAIAAVTQQWDKTIWIPIAMATGGLAIAGLKNSIPTYANGGLVDKGSLFVAGEAGAELVTTMPSGQTGVTNIAQFKQAMVEAIYECADVFQNSDGSVTLYLDGAEVARSKRFKSELNRTNAGLNLR